MSHRLLVGRSSLFQGWMHRGRRTQLRRISLIERCRHCRPQVLKEFQITYFKLENLTALSFAEILRRQTINEPTLISLSASFCKFNDCGPPLRGGDERTLFIDAMCTRNQFLFPTSVAETRQPIPTPDGSHVIEGVLSPLLFRSCCTCLAVFVSLFSGVSRRECQL